MDRGCWTRPRGDLMIGSAREGNGEKILHWEWMRIERDGDGRPVFYASPKGAPPASFPAVKSTVDEVEFVNAAHDFPQRVRFVRTTTGIDAEISLADGSKPMRWSYRAMGSSTAK